MPAAQSAPGDDTAGAYRRYIYRTVEKVVRNDAIGLLDSKLDEDTQRVVGDHLPVEPV